MLVNIWMNSCNGHTETIVSISCFAFRCIDKVGLSGFLCINQPIDLFFFEFVFNNSWLSSMSGLLCFSESEITVFIWWHLHFCETVADVAGEVAELGPEVSAFKKGDKVVGMLNFFVSVLDVICAS